MNIKNNIKNNIVKICLVLLLIAYISYAIIIYYIQSIPRDIVSLPYKILSSSFLGIIIILTFVILSISLYRSYKNYNKYKNPPNDKLKNNTFINNPNKPNDKTIVEHKGNVIYNIVLNFILTILICIISRFLNNSGLFLFGANYLYNPFDNNFYTISNIKQKLITHYYINSFENTDKSINDISNKIKSASDWELISLTLKNDTIQNDASSKNENVLGKVFGLIIYYIISTLLTTISGILCLIPYIFSNGISFPYKNMTYSDAISVPKLSFKTIVSYISNIFFASLDKPYWCSIAHEPYYFTLGKDNAYGAQYYAFVLVIFTSFIAITFHTNKHYKFILLFISTIIIAIYYILKLKNYGLPSIGFFTYNNNVEYKIKKFGTDTLATIIKNEKNTGQSSPTTTEKLIDNMICVYKERNNIIQGVINKLNKKEKNNSNNQTIHKYIFSNDYGLVFSDITANSLHSNNNTSTSISTSNINTDVNSQKNKNEGANIYVKYFENGCNNNTDYYKINDIKLKETITHMGVETTYKIQLGKDKDQIVNKEDFSEYIKNIIMPDNEKKGKGTETKQGTEQIAGSIYDKLHIVKHGYKKNLLAYKDANNKYHVTNYKYVSGPDKTGKIIYTNTADVKYTETPQKIINKIVTGIENTVEKITDKTGNNTEPTKILLKKGGKGGKGTTSMQNISNIYAKTLDTSLDTTSDATSKLKQYVNLSIPSTQVIHSSDMFSEIKTLCEKANSDNYTWCDKTNIIEQLKLPCEGCGNNDQNTN